MKVTVFGTGRWASFLTWYLSRGGNDVCVVGRRESAAYQTLRQTHTNGLVTLDDSVRFTDEKSEGVGFSDVFVVSISSQALRSFM